LFQDHKFSRRGANPGGCGLAYVPGEMAKVVAEVGSYAVCATFTRKPGVHTARFALWDFHDKTDAEAKVYVTSVQAQTERLLATLDFANPRLKPAFWTAKRKELVQYVPEARKCNPKLVARIEARIAEADKLHAQIAADEAAGKAVPIEVENKLIGALDKLSDAYWDLRLAALFGDE